MGNSKYLKVGLHNAGSLGTGHDNFIVAMERYSVDIMAINETWIREGEIGRAPSVSNYRLRYIPRPTHTRDGRGGGVGFYIKRGVNVRTCSHPINPNIDQMWLKLTVKSSKLIIGTAYRPQWVNVNDFFEALMNSVSTFAYCDNLIILGDFNIDILTPNDTKTMIFKEFLTDTELSQVVDKPTHFTDHSQTLIDVICTNVRTRNVCVELVGSDIGHAFVTCEFIFKKPKIAPRTIVYRPMKDICLDLFNSDLESIRWNLIRCADHVDDMVTNFNSIITLLFDLHAPVKSRVIKELPSPWLTDNVRLMMRLRDAALVRYRDTKMETHKLFYKDLKKQVIVALYCEKKAFFEQNINCNNHNSKVLWKNLKSKILPPKSMDLPLHFDNPDMINDHFLNVPDDTCIRISDLTFFEFNKYCSSTFSLKPTDSITVLKFLRQIKSNALGIDKISLDMITLTLPQSLDTITAIVNKSIVSAVFPTAWKKAVVKPIPKIPNPHELKDLRPISLLPCLSKVLEKVVCSQMTEYLETQQILPELQSGFRKNRGTTTALLDVTDNILAAQDAGMGTILVLLDFSRAFDSINTSLLLSKLNYYGFETSVIKWFDSYLSKRAQSVEINKDNGVTVASQMREVSRGVPQGSILGPVLFILYSADITNCIQHCKFHVYADDIQMYLSFKPEDLRAAEIKIMQDLDRVQAWAMSNSLLLNAKKTKYMMVGTKTQVMKLSNMNPKLAIGGEIIERVFEARNLGLILDEQLRFERHVSETVRNSFYRLKVLYKIRNFLSTDLRIMLVDSLVLSKFNYVDCVYGPRLLAKTSRRIQMVQNACARFCFDVPPRSHITPFLNQHNILKMESRRALHLATLMFDVVKSQKPQYLFLKFDWARDYNRYTARTSSLLLRTPRHGSAAFRGSFRFCATKCWNSLPPPLRALRCKSNFRLKFKKILLDLQKPVQ